MSNVFKSNFEGIDQLAPILSKAQKKWRLAYTTLFSIRALLSLEKEILAKKFLRTQSYILVDVEPDQYTKVNHSSLCELVKEKNTTQLVRFGGVEGVAAELQINPENGIRGNAEDIASLHQKFGSNSYQKPPAKTFHIVLDVIVEAFIDPFILILVAFATLSLIFGMRTHGVKGMSDGGSIFAAVLLEIAVSAFTNFWPRKEFKKLSRASDNIQIDVTRNGQKQKILIINVVVGDVVWLKAGDQIPADGLLLDGQPLQVDESSMTGESEPVEVNRHNPFLLSGSKVIDGNARMLVTSVGRNTEWGRIMRSISSDLDEKTPLEAKLKKLAFIISTVSMLVAFLVLLILLAFYFIGDVYADNEGTEFADGEENIHDIFNAVLGILATPVVIAAGGIPEGLMLAFKVTLAYSTMRMQRNKALVRKLTACEAMGSVTVICTDKKGTLTMKDMKVNKFWLGWRYIEEGDSSSIAPNVLELLCQGVGLNETRHPSGFMSELSDKAIHEWSIKEMSLNIEELRKNYDILCVERVNSEKKRSGVLIRKKADKTIHVHQKGVPEIILGMCSHHHDGTGFKVFNNAEREKLQQVIQDMETNGLQCIAFAHKQISQDDYDRETFPKLEEECLTLLGLVGLKQPCQTRVKEAVIDCQSAGVTIKMITEDDVSTAKAVATECGIIELNQDTTTGQIVEGEEFSNYTHDERMQKVDRIRVIARASPLHKLRLVQCLKEKGQVVAVTGHGTEDAVSLRAANVGLSMGIQSTDMAKESSDIVILENDFASVVEVLRWGRGLYIHIQTFTQFQLTVSIASLVIDTVTAISSGEPPTINIVASISAGKVPYATLQLLWVKLIVGTLAALALTIGQPTDDVMKKPPVSCGEPFITNMMWINMLAQAFYQIVVLLTIQFQGGSIFGANSKERDTMIFNTFVLLQVFMLLNSRKSQRNVVKGKQRKKLFWGIIGIIIVLQVVMVELLKRFAGTKKLSWRQWGACFGIAAVSSIIEWLVKYVPVPC